MRVSSYPFGSRSVVSFVLLALQARFCGDFPVQPASLQQHGAPYPRNPRSHCRVGAGGHEDEEDPDARAGLLAYREDEAAGPIEYRYRTYNRIPIPTSQSSVVKMKQMEIITSAPLHGGRTLWLRYMFIPTDYMFIPTDYMFILTDWLHQLDWKVVAQISTLGAVYSLFPRTSNTPLRTPPW